MRHHDPVSLVAHILPAVALNTLIAMGITWVGSSNFWGNMVFSQCIGLIIGLLIHSGIRWLISDWKTQWRRLSAIVPVGVVAGFLIGTRLGDWLTGSNTNAYWTERPERALGFLALSLAAGAALTYYFVSRAQLAKEKQVAEAAQRQAAESRLKLLEAQLEPHMLFNTLANLRVLVARDPQAAQMMLDHLIAYLRATLSASRASSHTLSDEFDRLRDYLELMAVRMGPRLQFTLDLPDDLRAQQVPPLLLQPLVENSIQHGLEPKVGGGSITICASRDGNTLRLQVEDTGAGLGQHATEHARPGGFGLTQVRERLATLYGNAAAIDLVAAHAGGTLSTITFPINLPV
jgi:two-component sensor histidine kinase